MNQELIDKSHDTTVIGMDESGKVVWLKSYKYSDEKEFAQADLKLVIDSGLSWKICAIGNLTVADVYRESFDFVKKVSEDDRLWDKVQSHGLDAEELLNGKDWYFPFTNR